MEWVGGRRPVPVDIRLIAATNKDLKEEIRQNRFRQDLYFRLNVIHIHMPALREIRTDIVAACDAFRPEIFKRDRTRYQRLFAGCFEGINRLSLAGQRPRTRK